MALVVIGLFVLVWIISAVVKATQSNGPTPKTGGVPNRQPRPLNDAPRVERTSNTDIDRFMAEIDRLRNRGEGAPAGSRPEPPRPVSSRPVPPPMPEAPRPRPATTTRREKEKRPRAIQRTPAPPPLPSSDAVPVLRPLSPETATATPAAPAKPVRPAKTAQVGPAVVVTPVSKIVQDLLKAKHGPAAALILAEIFGEPPGKRGTVRGPHSHPHG